MNELLHNKSFIVRTISGIILAAVLIVFFVLGGNVLLVFTGILSILGLREFYGAEKLRLCALSFIGYIGTVLYYVLLYLNYIGVVPDMYYILFLFVVIVIAVCFTFVLTFPKFSFEQVQAAFFGIFYVSVSLSFLWQIRVHPWGAYIVWLAVFSSWGCDTCAYLVGMLFGKHKMAPELSPKKSWEGVIGGVLGAAVLSLIYGLIVGNFITDMDHEWIIFPCICIVGAAVGIIGDLVASAIKRKIGIKDFGHIIPGHGGILDRFDGMILTAPMIYLFVIYRSFIA